jgi:SOS-response transcriptional repressor LexA
MIIDEPTDRQLEIVEFIAHHLEDEGCAPTIREIGDAFDITSTHGVDDHLKAIARKRLIDRGEKGKARQLRIMRQGWFWLKARKGYEPPAAIRDLAKRVAKAISMLERAGTCGYILEVDDVISVLKGVQAA